MEAIQEEACTHKPSTLEPMILPENGRWSVPSDRAAWVKLAQGGWELEEGGEGHYDSSVSELMALMGGLFSVGRFFSDGVLLPCVGSSFNSFSWVPEAM